MIGELVRVWTNDGLQLQGLYCASGSDSSLPAVLHLHGASSNFYRSQFLDSLADALTECGFAFLTGNTRGHDIMNSIYTRDPTVRMRIGVAYEVFGECLLDIEAWLDLLAQRGHQRVVLLGHSFGAQKAAFYQSDREDERVQGLILMSPADRGLWVEAMGSEAQRLLNWADEMVSSGQGDALVPGGPAPYPMSACTVQSLLVTATADIFRFGRPEEPWSIVSRLSCPILATMGTVAEFISTSPQTAMARLKARAVSSPRCDTVVLDGAPHNYRGHEAEINEVVVDWLKDVFAS